MTVWCTNTLTVLGSVDTVTALRRAVDDLAAGDVTDPALGQLAVDLSDEGVSFDETRQVDGRCGARWIFDTDTVPPTAAVTVLAQTFPECVLSLSWAEPVAARYGLRLLENATVTVACDDRPHRVRVVHAEYERYCAGLAAAFEWQQRSFRWSVDPYPRLDVALVGNLDADTAAWVSTQPGWSRADVDGWSAGPVVTADVVAVKVAALADDPTLVESYHYLYADLTRAEADAVADRVATLTDTSGSQLRNLVGCLLAYASTTPVLETTPVADRILACPDPAAVAATLAGMGESGEPAEVAAAAAAAACGVRYTPTR